MKEKDFLSISSLTCNEVDLIVQNAKLIKNQGSQKLLTGKIIAMIFEKPSLRTRLSFEVGILDMGGESVYLGKDDVGLGVREPESDIAGVLDRWVDGIVARVYSHRSLEILSRKTSIPVINALSDIEHPCQAMGDLLTILEHKKNFEGLKVAFIGDGNNVASSLALACTSVSADFVLSSPRDYKVAQTIWTEAERRALRNNSSIDWIENPSEAVQCADVVYTDVWISMGQDSERAERLRAFEGYQVDRKLLDLAKPDAIFMHDMPAHRGEEISDGMLEDDRSVVFDQAENRLHAQKAILAKLFSGF